MIDEIDDILHKAHSNGKLIAVAESCTGGLLGATLTERAGASAVFLGGFVTYSNETKKAFLGVRTQTLKEYGAVSEEVAREMAKGVLLRSNAHIVLSITGIAGPGRSEHKPEGRVCFACARTDQETYCQTVEFGAIGRQNVREAACKHALYMLYKML